MSMVCAAESPLFDFASANCLSKRFVDQEHASALEELLPGPGHRCVGVFCGVVGTPWRAAANSRSTQRERQQDLPTRVFVALQRAHRTGRARLSLCSLALTKRLPRGRQLRWQRTALWQQRRRSLACSPFFTALRRSRTPKCMRQDHRIANSFR